MMWTEVMKSTMPDHSIRVLNSTMTAATLHGILLQHTIITITGVLNTARIAATSGQLINMHSTSTIMMNMNVLSC